MKAKPIYKILDDKGRVLIPKALRTAAEMDHGDIFSGLAVILVITTIVSNKKSKGFAEMTD